MIMRWVALLADKIAVRRGLDPELRTPTDKEIYDQVRILRRCAAR